jgi:hypothetical protein
MVGLGGVDDGFGLLSHVSDPPPSAEGKPPPHLSAIGWSQGQHEVALDNDLS